LNIASFIARRIVFQKNHSFSRFIIRLSAAATAITVSNKVFSFWGHIHVQQEIPSTSGLAEELPSYKNDTIEKALHRIPAVKYTDVFATKSAMIKTTESIEGVLLKGVDASFHKERIMPYLIEGNWLRFDTNRTDNPILISAYTARQLQLKTGDKALLYFIENAADMPRVRPVTVYGIYKTSIEEYDKTFALVDLSLIQKINGWSRNEIAGYEVVLKDYRDDYKTSNQLLDAIPTSWYSSPVREIYPNIFDWLNLQNTNRQIIIIIMCVVAIMNLITCLLILVLERSRMIGLLKATGAANNQIQSIFWQQGILIALTGIILGNILGLGLCWLQQSTGFIHLDETAYYVKQAPVQLIWWQVVLVNLITFTVSLLILLIPSLLVRRINPVKALRFD
jgi:lipoprotein-releasing system permease protein